MELQIFVASFREKHSPYLNLVFQTCWSSIVSAITGFKEKQVSARLAALLEYFL